MNPLPDIVILDFCEWLKQKLDADDTQSVTLLDMIVGDGNAREYLQEYAHEFLDKRKSECCFKTLIQQFLQSKEFRQVTERCKKDCRFFRECNYDLLDCLYKRDIDHAFYHFIKEHHINKRQQNLYDISEYRLANYMRHIIYSDNEIKHSSQFLHLMTSSKQEFQKN